MGTGVSKVDNTPLVSLCKERKELIRATAGCRYDLASAHILYFQSLLDVGNALNQFVEESLVIHVDFPHEDSSGENSHLKFSDSDSQTDLESLTDYVHGKSEDSDGPEFSIPKKQGQAGVNANIHCMRRSSPEIPFRVYEQPGVMFKTFEGQGLSNMYPRYGNGAPHNDVRYAYYNNGVLHNDRYPQYGNWSSSRAPMDFPPNDPRFPQCRNVAPFGFSTDTQHNNPYYSQTKTAPASSLSSRDYFDPFCMIDDFSSCYHSQDSYESGSDTIIYNVREVREREGIPDLEDDIEGAKSGGDASKKMESEEDIRGDSGGATSVPEPSKTDEDAKSSKEKEIKSEPGTSDEDGESLGSSSSATLDTSGARDLQEVVKEIRDAFETGYNYGKEVSVLLEAGRLPYQPMAAKFKAFASQILGLIVPFMVTSSRRPTYMLSNCLASRRVMLAKDDENFTKDAYKKIGNLSSTLEKLYVWEKKLYEEVMVEEKLRVIYDKECRRLKALDDEGAESSKIDIMHASIKRLLSKINVAVRAVDVISRKIHKLRDKELHPQLNELIEGLIRMWKLMVECHRKQFCTIIGTKAFVHIVNADNRKDSSLKATLKLETEILNWATRFSDYIKTQKTFVKLLNEWLLRCLFQEPEETDDGIAPFSPSRIGAPSVFIACNDWYHAIEKISESEVSNSINDFASSLHQLWEKQEEERRLRIKAENLSKDFEKQLRSQHVLSGIYWDESSAAMRKKLDKQTARHKEIIKQVNDTASSCLQGGLVPIFKALESFCSQNLKAYEHVKLTNGNQKM